MKKNQSFAIFLLRTSLGILFFYAGVSKIINPHWSAAGYLNSAQTFSVFYHWLAQASLLPIVNFINEWGLLLLGVSLLLGIFVKYSSYAGIVLMILYTLPITDFPYIGDHSFLIDEHLIYIFSLYLLITFNAGTIWGLDEKLNSIFKKNKK